MAVCLIFKYGNDSAALHRLINMISAFQYFIIPHNCDNWLDEWWLKKAYLQFRDPLMPFLNTAGPFAANNPGHN